ncbi:MAG: hypothetical protein HQ546_04540 [Planctomycetes bacterium]|nr:hypothetical protein [Planctomycetota bacterium]
MARYQRKTAPKVKGGKVQRKNRWQDSPSAFNNPGPYPAFERERPGVGYRHLIRKRELYEFVDLLPDWDELSKGLKAIILAGGEDGCHGWHDRGVVGICAWDRSIIWEDPDPEFLAAHEGILSKLGVDSYEDWEGLLHTYFDERTAKAFQLVHVFVHEMGHHHDMMTTRPQRAPARGESYAEEYARKHEDEILQKYWRYLDGR